MKRELFALILAMLLPSGLAYWYFVVLASEQVDQTNVALVVAYSAAKVLLVVLPLVFWWWSPNRESTESARTENRWRWIQIGVVFGLATGALIIAVAHLLRDTVLAGVPARVVAKTTEFGCRSPMRYVMFAVFLSVMHSLFEEYYWRWFVFSRLRRWVRLPSAAIVSALTFSAHHLFVLDFYLPGRFWTAAVPFTLAIALGGMFWAWLYEKSHSLFGPWISHMIVDAAIMIVGYKMVCTP